MNINATLLNYYLLCHRKMWLHAHAIRMEHTSDVVYEGKLIGETTYPQRAERYQEVAIATEWDGVPLTAKIDFYDPREGVVHEVKKSAAREQAHVAQVQFYLFVLRQNGVRADYGIIEYPKFRHTERVELNEPDQKQVKRWIKEVQALLTQEQCPPRLQKSTCRSCSYFDFCWSQEPEAA